MRKHKNAVVLMTALLPTTGHKDLIEFAAEIADRVNVIVSSRSFEPIEGVLRYHAIGMEFLNNLRVLVFHHEDDAAPQNDDGTKEFWDYWKKIISSNSLGTIDCVVASEPYGKVMADALDVDFIPYDIDRDINDAQGTEVRDSFITRQGWDKVMPSFKSLLSTHFVMFGQESVGKSLFTKQVLLALDNDYLSVTAYPEYARPYLLSVGEEITSEKMDTIVEGQFSYQHMGHYSPKSAINIYDTDLLSTLGYYKLFNSNGGHLEYDEEELLSLIQVTTPDLYFLLPDDIPFEEDVLRYGGNKRESSYAYWKDLLDEYKMPYVEVPKGDFHSKREFIEDTIGETIYNKHQAVIEFQRD